jgi:hypothetical protein
MNRLEAALVDVAGHLRDAKIPFMVIGGFANLFWGRPRLTEALDLKIVVDEDRWPDLIENLRAEFAILPSDPLSFMRETRVLPIVTRSGIRADLVCAGLPYEAEAVRRARSVTIGGAPVPVCTPEDLVLHKLVSERPRDREDVEGVIHRQGGALDRGYLDPRVHELALGLERPEIEDFYRAGLRAAGAG